MFRYAPATLLLPAALCTAAETPQQAKQPASHQEFSLALLEWLGQTEQCLASCTDKASVEAAMPRLRELAARARELEAAQRALPEPSVQDYMAADRHIGSFNVLWQAIGGHIERLQQEKLLTPALRELLCIAPEKA